MAAPGGPDGPQEREGIPEKQARQIALAGAVVLVVSIVLIFIVENARSVRVSFVFFSAHISLIWVIVLSAVVGCAAGMLISVAVRRRFGRREK